MNTANSPLFKISQIAKSCSVSRATILRLEEDGLITPAYKDPESGYRYYSLDDILTIREILLLRSFGFSTQQILEFQKNPHDYSPLITSLEERIDTINEVLESLRTKATRTSSMKVTRVSTPVQFYYEKSRVMIGTNANVRDLIRETREEAVVDGVHLNLSKPVLIHTDRTDLFHGTYAENIPFLYTVCIPVTDTQGKHIIAHPPGDVLKILWDDNYDHLIQCMDEINKEMAALKVRPIGVVGFEIILPDFPLKSDPEEAFNNRYLFLIGVPVMPI